MDMSNGSGSGGGADDCDTASLYVKITGTVIFVVVWPFVVLDMKWFPLGRPAAALLGAVLMVVFNVVTQTDVYDIEGEFGNLQTIFLLVGMMILSYYFDREGLLRIVSLWIFGDRKPFWSILWKVCLLSAGLSAFITNDATCLVLTPLLLAEFQRQGRNQKELLPLTLGIATSANIGSAATVFGNPQNAFIASVPETKVTLVAFFIALLPAALLGLVISVGLLYLFFIKTVLGKHTAENGMDRMTESVQDAEPNAAEPAPTSLSEERKAVALSYDQSDQPYLSSQAARERDIMYSGTHMNLSVSPSHQDHHIQGRAQPASSFPSTSSANPREGAALPRCIGAINAENSTADDTDKHDTAHNSKLDPAVVEAGEVHLEVNQVRGLKERTIREKIFIGWLVFISVLLVVLLVIPPPPTVKAEFNLGCVPLGASILTMLVDTIVNKKYAYDAMLKIDWTVILMFMGLFVWLEGFKKTCFPNQLLNILKPYMNLYRLEGVVLFTVFVIVSSNILSNVPLVILFVHRIPELCGDQSCEGALGGLLLAWVSTIAGNFTLIGSVANLIVAEKARSSVGYRLTFWKYLRFGLWSTLIVIFVPLPVVYFLGQLAPT